MTPATVLIVDDEPGIREALADLLSDYGYPVARTNGVEALAYLRDQPRPGLIILDLMLPILNGFDVLATLDAEPGLAGIPTVVVSAFHKLDDRLPGPVIARIHKPINIQALLGVVAKNCGEAVHAT